MYLIRDIIASYRSLIDIAQINLATMIYVSRMILFIFQQSYTQWEVLQAGDCHRGFRGVGGGFFDIFTVHQRTCNLLLSHNYYLSSQVQI